MKKIELEIDDIRPSGSQNGAYALILSEKGGYRKLPVIIGGNEAQAIAIELEQMKPSRPLTHDLFKSFSDAFGVIITEVLIHDLQEGVFYAKLIAVQNGKVEEIDARTSDAVALAVRFSCPVYCLAKVLDVAGIDASDPAQIEESEFDEEEFEEEQLSKIKTIPDLEKELNDALSDEDYERASKIRDEIKRLKNE